MSQINHELAMDEPEKEYHIIRARAIENEQLLIVGRLASAIVHEINNPLQAIRGAMMLAKEDLTDQGSVEEYLDLSLHETERIIGFIQLITEIYRPKMGSMTEVDLPHLINQVITLSHDEFSQKNLQIRLDIKSDLPKTIGFHDRLLLAFLGILLELTANDIPAKGSEIEIQGISVPPYVSVKICLPGKIPEKAGCQPGGQSEDESNPFAAVPGWALPLEIIKRHHGTLDMNQDGESITIQVKLPAQNPVNTEQLFSK